MEDFAAEVGSTGPVSVAGWGTRRSITGDGGRVVNAPAGILRIDAAEMVAECGAGTSTTELLAALAEQGQTVSLPASGTVGGALAVGHSDVTRLGHGSIRDVLLQARYVSASGHVVKAGGPTVKNVSGFDLCRLLVGSYGTLGFLGEVIVRTRPLPRHSVWVRRAGDPFRLLVELHRPVSLLWDGTTTWARLDGHVDDIAAAVDRFGLEEVDGPPSLPGPYRWSIPPGDLGEVLGPDRDDGAAFVAEVGVGLVHHSRPRRPTRSPAPVVDLHRRIKERFDPTGRLNPGVDPLLPDVDPLSAGVAG